MITYSRIGLKLLVSIACTDLLIMTIFRLIRIETWLSPLLVDLTNALLLCVVASYLILHWVVKPMKILEERELLEENLLSLTLRYKAILAAVPDIITEVDNNKTYTWVNKAGYEFFGDDVIGKEAAFYFEGEQRTYNIVYPLFHGSDEVINVESWQRRKDGEKRLLTWWCRMLKDSEGNITGALSTAKDITEHRLLESQLRHAQKMEAVGTLAGGVAHDFNNILNIIMGYGNLVMDTLAADSPAREDMHVVLVAADRAADLTKRLLVFSRSKVVEVAPVNINELILGLEKMLTRIIRESIEFRLDLADHPLVVLADVGQIEQVLMNLAVNAKDAMQGSGRLVISTGLAEIDAAYVAAYGYGKPGRYALITVADTGEGMDAETQKKIFEPFFTTKGVGEGTGLGLAISYGIIKQHNGYINVYSEPGEGTVFKIYLPLGEKTAPAKKTPDEGLVKGGNETILVAEDDAALRKLSRIVLESFGYTVITAEDGDDALAKFLDNRERINLVLLDMIMPKKNGKEVAEAIRKVCPGMKILFASGYTMEIITNKELLEDGFNFIQKPYQSKGLLLKVREVLDK